MLRRLGALPALGLALAAMAGCAAPKALPPAPKGPPPGIEGRYRGTARLVRAGNRFCPRSGPRVYELENGVITLAYSTAARPGARPDRVPLTAPVQPDGTIQTTDGVGTMNGTLHDGLLEITVASSLCEHRWTMKRVP